MNVLELKIKGPRTKAEFAVAALQALLSVATPAQATNSYVIRISQVMLDHLKYQLETLP